MLCMILTCMQMYIIIVGKYVHVHDISAVMYVMHNCKVYI